MADRTTYTSGSAYPTLDGTCIREYVHVSDLIDKNLRGLDWLRAERDPAVFYLGTAHGISVAEVLAVCSASIGQAVPYVTGPRRARDAAALVSRSQRTARDLVLQALHSTLVQMIRDAWRCHQTGEYSA